MDVKDKVLIISNEFPPNGGGRGVVAHQYCLALNAQGYNVTLLTSKIELKPQNFEDITIVEVKSIKKIWFIPYLITLSTMDLNSYKVIILNDIAAAYVAGIHFNKQILAKSLHLLHGDEPEEVYKCNGILKNILLFKYFYNKTIHNCKKIIAVSNYMKEKFLEETTFSDDKKIEVIYAGLSQDFFIQKEVNCKDIFEYKNKEIILSVSRIEKEKGFLDMYKVFKKLIKIENSFIWVIVGDGSFKKELVELVDKDKLKKQVIFKGKVPRNELYKYYKCADVFCLLSKYKESFGLVYLEAQAYGCSAVGYNKYGVKEALDDGKTGFLVNNIDEVLNILKTKKYLDLKQEDILSFANKFSLDKQVKVLEKYL